MTVETRCPLTADQRMMISIYRVLHSHSMCCAVVAANADDAAVQGGASPDVYHQALHDAATSCVQGYGHHTDPEFYGVPAYVRGV